MNPIDTSVVDASLTSGPLAGLPLLEDLPPLEGRRVLVRVDFNVPLGHDDDGHAAMVEDDFRIRAALPTLEWLTQRGASVTALTHLGRPGGVVDARFDVAPVRARLKELAPRIELLENVRFHLGEEENDPAFVDRLVAGFDYFVNDAFGASHRDHASIVGPPQRLPSAAGRLLQREVEVIGRLLTSPARPFVAVVGGAKYADKLGVLHSLVARVDLLVVGGGMAFTFLAAKGHAVGASMLDSVRLADCRALLKAAGGRVFLPSDLVALEPSGTIGKGKTGTGQVKIMGVELPPGWRGLDIGPGTAAAYADVVAGAGTVFWNGPMGVFEDDRFAAGTRSVAEAMAECKGFTVVGGGDVVHAVDRTGLADDIDFVSTGGGATLELLEYGDLPGLAALRAASNAPGQRRTTHGS